MPGVHEISSLSVPSLPRYARSVRMLAANLAAISKMSLEQVEDVRMIAEEAFILSCESGVDMVNIEFSLSDENLAMDFSLGEQDLQMDEHFVYADLILRAIADSFEIEEGHLKLEVSARRANEGE
ncbi:MAG: ATP-binding protein [Coriobacteriia bacterium]|nr:ATP-binding protein [Coriobacteriia bacterium]